MIVEGLCGIACVFSAYVMFTHKPWAQKTALIVQILILVGVLAGIAALTRDAGLRTPINVSLRGAMLALIVMGCSLLAIPGTRATFIRDHISHQGEG